MNKIVILLGGLGLIYLLYTVIPMMAPTLNPGLYTPYAIWALVLLFFYLFLPGNVGGWVYDSAIQGK